MMPRSGKCISAVYKEQPAPQTLTQTSRKRMYLPWNRGPSYHCRSNGNCNKSPFTILIVQSGEIVQWGSIEMEVSFPCAFLQRLSLGDHTCHLSSWLRPFNTMQILATGNGIDAITPGSSGDCFHCFIREPNVSLVGLKSHSLRGAPVASMSACVQEHKAYSCSQNHNLKS